MNTSSWPVFLVAVIDNCASHDWLLSKNFFVAITTSPQKFLWIVFPSDWVKYSSFVILRVTNDHLLATSLVDIPFVTFSNDLPVRKSVIVPELTGPRNCGVAGAAGGVTSGLLLAVELKGMGVAGGSLRRLMLPCIFSVCLFNALGVVKWVSHSMAITAMSRRSSALLGAFSRSGSPSLIRLSSSLTAGVKHSVMKLFGSWFSAGLNFLHVLPSFLAKEDSRGTTCGIVAPGAVYPATSFPETSFSATNLVSVNTSWPSQP